MTNNKTNLSFKEIKQQQYEHIADAFLETVEISGIDSIDNNNKDADECYLSYIDARCDMVFSDNSLLSLCYQTHDNHNIADDVFTRLRLYNIEELVWKLEKFSQADDLDDYEIKEIADIIAEKIRVERGVQEHWNAAVSCCYKIEDESCLGGEDSLENAIARLD